MNSQSIDCRPMTFGIPRIRADFVYPPIPIRTIDWQAYYDNDEPDDLGCMVTGTGRTETDAICDLIENHPREA